MNQILSVDSKNMIGKGSELLVKIPEDMSFFKRKTIGNTIIVGRKTLESFPNSKPLPNRKNIVITTQKDYKVDGAIVYNSIDDLLSHIDINDDSIYVCGGGEIYEQLIKYCNTLYITIINKDFGGDIQYVDYEKLGFKKVLEDILLDYEDFTYRHTVWKR